MKQGIRIRGLEAEKTANAHGKLSMSVKGRLNDKDSWK